MGISKNWHKKANNYLSECLKLFFNRLIKHCDNRIITLDLRLQSLQLLIKRNPMKDSIQLAVKCLTQSYQAYQARLSVLAQWQASGIGKSTGGSPKLVLPVVYGLAGLSLVLMGGCTPNEAVNTASEWQDADKAGVVGYGDRDKIILDNKADVTSRNHTSKYIELNDPVVESRAVIKAKQSVERSRTHQSQQEAEALREKLENSYARLAAERADVCPKLLQKDVDSSVIRRSNDVMIDDHCDYFIYPQPGQRIQVLSSSDQIEALLVAPALHNFANGDYRVLSSQKHIIRLAYDGATRKPNTMRYSVSVIVKD